MENWGQQCKHLTDQYKIRRHEMLLAILFYLIETRGILKGMGACQKQICGFCRNISQNIVSTSIFFLFTAYKAVQGFLEYSNVFQLGSMHTF